MGSFIGRHYKQFTRFIIVGLILLTVGAAFADNSKISPDLLPLLSNPTNTVNVIVCLLVAQIAAVFELMPAQLLVKIEAAA